jgi:serine/threonine-protein kinase HipA
MPDALDVMLGERRVGSFANLSGDYNLFSFDDEYAMDRDAPVLSQSFIGSSGSVLRVIPRTHRVAPPFFANLLPEEGAPLRALVARRYRINRSRDFPFLHVLGRDLPGAVVLRHGAGSWVEEADDRPDEIASPAERPLRFSLAGVQLKFSAGMVANRLTVPVTGIGGSWIVKLPANAFARLPENEYAMMELARAIGLDVPRVELIDVDTIEGMPADLPALRSDEPRLAYAIARFDRTSNSERIHCEDFNQIADQQPEHKYDGKASHWIANVVATLCESADLDEFVRRLVFGVCTGNNDMHLKNWALSYPGGRVARLAPLYDYVCTRLYYPHGPLALTIGGERAFERVGHDALRAFARRAEISVRRALVLADEVVEKLRDVWPAFKETIPDPALVAALESQFALVPLMRGR